MRIFKIENAPLGSVPCCSIAGAIGDIISAGIASATDLAVGGMNYDATIKTNESNEKNVAATNETNKQIQEGVNETNKQIQEGVNDTNKQIAYDANELARIESDKAYQRSTMTNQLIELQRAGYSMQQAKQLLANNLSSASYPAAPVTSAQMQAAQMQAAQMQPFQAQAPQMNINPSNIADMTSSLLDVGSDYSAPDGGRLGSLIASSALSFINENASEIDKLSNGSINTLLDFENWANSQPEDDKYRQFINSKDWKRCKCNLPATRAINAQFGNMFAANRTTEQLIKKGQLDIENQRLQNRITSVLADVKENGKALEFLNQELETKRTQFNLDNVGTFMQADLEYALNNIARLSLDSHIANNPEYRKYSLSLALQDSKTQFLVSQVLELQKSVQLSGYSSLSDAQKQMIGVLSVFDDFGLTATDWGTAISYCEAAGVPIMDSLKKVIDWVKGDLSDDSPETMNEAEFKEWYKKNKGRSVHGMSATARYYPSYNDKGELVYIRRY